LTDVQIGFAGIALLLALIALRTPIGVALISVSFGGIWVLMGERAAWGALGVVPYNFAASWQLSSIPMFLLMGFFCYHAGLTKGLFDAARLWLARLPGGLAVSAVFGAAGFAAVTGSSIACAAAMGRIAVPEMMRHRYDASLATGTVAAAGTIGALIPPSILLILYGIIAQVPITLLFIGGVVAGLLTVVGYVSVIVIRAKLDPSLAPYVVEEITWTDRFFAIRDTWPVMLLIIGVFGGLFSGAFSATEAGAVGASMSMVIAMLKRSLTCKAVKDALTETLLTSASLFIIAIGASLLSRFMALSGTGEQLNALVSGQGLDPVVLLLLIAVVYIILGMFLEPIGAMLLTLPIFLPILRAADIDLIWYGILLAKFLEIGMITPPIGLNVFVIKGVVGKIASTGTIFRGVVWFLVADVILVLLLILFPEIVLFLPRMLG